jgi:ElaB/YqjD/DUF883 family membrane-anchored ribosome-binding protein
MWHPSWWQQAAQTASTPETQRQRLLDLFDYGAKLVGSLGVILGAAWVGTAKIARPFFEWRREHNDTRKRMLTVEVRDILAPELAKLDEVCACTDRIETVLRRQTVLFNDVDKMLALAVDNKERLDEVNALLDAVGLTSDRRVDETRRQKVDRLIDDLRTRQRERRRAVKDDLDTIRDAADDADAKLHSGDDPQ